MSRSSLFLSAYFSPETAQAFMNTLVLDIIIFIRSFLNRKGRKKYSLSDLNDNITFEKIKKSCKICLIDDEINDVKIKSKTDRLISDGYKLQIMSDIDNFIEFKKNRFNVVILDIQGVGLKYAEKSAGWGVLSMIKQDLPHTVVIIFSGSDSKIREYGEIFKSSDDYITKDTEYVEFRQKINLAIRKAFSYEYHAEILVSRLKKGDIDKDTLKRLNKYLKLIRGNKSQIQYTLNHALAGRADTAIIGDFASAASLLFDVYDKFK